MTIRWNSRAGHLSISESLLAALGFPHVLIIERVGESGLILYQRGDKRMSPDAKERKVNYPQRAMPRLGIGAPAALELGLRDGRYAARVDGGAIVAERE
jgi:hypothetical protein